MTALAKTTSLDAARVEAICRLNDDLRVQGRGGRIMLTDGVRSLPPVTLAIAFRAIRSFDAFSPDNDPHGEHDFGSVEIAGVSLCWKIDTYDRSLTVHSPDAADSAVTARVMTVMCADEY